MKRAAGIAAVIAAILVVGGIAAGVATGVIYREGSRDKADAARDLKEWCTSIDIVLWEPLPPMRAVALPDLRVAPHKVLTQAYGIFGRPPDPISRPWEIFTADLASRLRTGAKATPAAKRAAAEITQFHDRNCA